MKINKTILLLVAGLFWLQSIAQSPYIYKVYEYMPAPGQFVNELPEYEPGDTKNDMRLKAEESIADDERILVSLGGYGGYIVFGFDHMVKNVMGEYDFKILANAFYANANPNPNAPKEGGSCEPGIVMVSFDANGNGKPDDEWYELAGSEYYKPETIKNYKIKYFRPDENKIKTPDHSYPALNDTTYVRWESNQGDYGYVYKNIYHKQPYYPLWMEEDELTFEGTKLADNYIDESGNGSYYVQYAYAWGYVDNHPNNSELSNFKIDWAIDKNGNSVQLPGIHFVKVYTGVNQYCGWLGETSTEVMGAIDLHLQDGLGINEDPTFRPIHLLNTLVYDVLTVTAQTSEPIVIYNSFGKKVISTQLEPGTNRIQCEYLPSGVYIITTKDSNFKIIKQ